eukprot:scaffold48_cov311-Pinguiococcus_pyrenoidosus.AAC.341
MILVRLPDVDVRLQEVLVIPRYQVDKLRPFFVPVSQLHCRRGFRPSRLVVVLKQMVEEEVGRVCEAVHERDANPTVELVRVAVLSGAARSDRDDIESGAFLSLLLSVAEADLDLRSTRREPMRQRRRLAGVDKENKAPVPPLAVVGKTSKGVEGKKSVLRDWGKGRGGDASQNCLTAFGTYLLTGTSRRPPDEDPRR